MSFIESCKEVTQDYTCNASIKNFKTTNEVNDDAVNADGSDALLHNFHFEISQIENCDVYAYYALYDTNNEASVSTDSEGSKYF
jgi:hypothetical protein